MYSLLNIVCLLVVSARLSRSSYATNSLPQAVFEGRHVFIIPLSLAVAKSEFSPEHRWESAPYSELTVMDSERERGAHNVRLLFYRPAM